MSLIEQLTSLFAPDDCLNCGREGSLLCSPCNICLPQAIGRCFGCYQKISGIACKVCLGQSGLNSVQAATNYADVSKLLVASLKFRGNQSAARCMAAAMLRSWSPPTNAILVHMPATTAHVRERGFDQSALLCKHLSRATGLRRLDALRRSGSQHQLGSDRQQRLKQLTGSLSVARPALVRNQSIILVDDVLTTGSSVTAAAQALKQAGAKRVDVLVFAQSVKPQSPAAG